MSSLPPRTAATPPASTAASRTAGPHDDVVVLNNDVIAHRGWLETPAVRGLLRGAAGIVGPKLLYPDGRIQSAGSYRNLGAPEWFDHRYRFKPADYGPANVPDAALAVTGACMYLSRSLIDEIGCLRRGLPDGATRTSTTACVPGKPAAQVRYEPAARLTHVESPTRGTEVGERELALTGAFWSKWGAWFDGRERAHAPTTRCGSST